MEIFKVLMSELGFPLITLALVVAAIVVVTYHFSKPKQAPLTVPMHMQPHNMWQCQHPDCVHEQQTYGPMAGI